MAKELKPFDLAQVELTGTHLVEASAGTGKTYAITGLVLRLLLDPERALKLEEILVVSFTEASTQELIERIGKRLRSALAAFEAPEKALEQDLGDDLLRQLLLNLKDHWEVSRKRLALAIRSLDESRIFTIHGFCRRQLRDYAFEAGQAFEADLLPNLSDLMHQAVYDLWSRHCTELPAWQYAYLSEQGYSPSALIKYAETLGRHAELDRPRPEYPGELDLSPIEAARLKAQGSWDRAAWDKVFNAPQISGTYIKKPSIPKILDQMEQVILRGPALRAWEKESWAQLFLSEVLETKLKKDKELPPLPPGAEDLGQFLRLRAAFEGQLTAWEHWFRMEFIDQLEARLTKLKQQAALYSFDDLLLELDRALSSKQGEALAQRSTYKAALIDEFQDTDPVQYRIFKTLFAREGRALFLIGDPKQAIYAFRGADIFAYRQAGEEAQVKHHMDTNWRSDPGLIDALNGLFTHGWPPVEQGLGSRTVGGPFHLAFISYAPVAAQAETNRLKAHRTDWAPLTLHFLPKTDQEDYNKNPAAIDKGWVKRELPVIVANQVVEALSGGALIETEPGQWRSLKPSDIALLVRRNDEGQALNEALAHAGVPALFLGSQKLYRTEEALELHRLMSALLDPRHPDKFLAALSGPCFGLTDVALAELKTDQKALQLWQARFLRWANAWQEQGFAAALGALIEEGGVGPALMTHQEGPRRWSNLLQLLESLQAEVSRNHLGAQALLRCLERRINDPEETNEEVSAHQDADAVRILTIHKSKGLEFPVVFLPYLWEGLYRSDKDPIKAPVHHEDDGRLRLELKADDRITRRAEQEALAESLRLLYVGLTRAKHQCHIHFGPIGDWWHSALAYLLLRPPIAPDEEDPKEWLKQYKDWDSEALYTWLESEVLLPLGEKASLVTLQKQKPKIYHPPATQSEGSLQVWSYGAQPDFFYRIGSYSSLSRKAPSPLWAETGLDRDFGLSDPVAASGEVPLADFPKGARAGDFFHHLFENLDFTEGDRAKIQAQLGRSLRLYRFEEDRWIEPLTDWTLKALQAPLGEVVGPLAEITKADRLVEMEFTLPLPGRSLKAETLAQVFNQAGLESYAGEVARLGFQPLRGYLKGFVDLFFRRGQTYYLLDYKSNHLGGTFGDYGPSHLQRAMDEHHYPLQAWLYCLAAHRHLRRVLPGYDYDQHFGGAAYLFLRGISGAAGQSVCWLKPPLEALEALDRLIEGAS